MDDYQTLPANIPAPRDDGASDHLPGTALPALRLASTSGRSVALNSLDSGRTIIYLYPLTGRPGADLPEGWDLIPGARGCTPEACGFRDHHRDLLDAGVTGVYGLSSQDSDYQREVVERLRLPFEMLADPELTLARALGLPTLTVAGMTLFARLTLVIRDDVIEHAFYPIFPPDEHARQVLGWLRENPIH
ncbi:MAG TPA: peroxiredoxin [Pseudonocardia sp.]|jgi:peroxiredoxin|nr:peroxiredoxin [Pseudonocardia sp.]